MSRAILALFTQHLTISINHLKKANIDNLTTIVALPLNLYTKLCSEYIEYDTEFVNIQNVILRQLMRTHKKDGINRLFN